TRFPRRVGLVERIEGARRGRGLDAAVGAEDNAGRYQGNNDRPRSWYPRDAASKDTTGLVAFPNKLYLAQHQDRIQTTKCKGVRHGVFHLRGPRHVGNDVEVALRVGETV